MGILVLITLCAAIPGAAQEPAAPQGPASYWRLDENSGTTSGNAVGGPPGAHQNTPTISATVAPVSYNNNPIQNPRALQFDGTTEAVVVPNFGTFANMSVSVWVRPTGTTGTRQSIVSYKEGSGVNMGFVLCLNESGANQYPRIWVMVNGAWLNAEQAVSVPQNVWTHLVGVYDGTSIILYRNGASAATTGAAGSMTNTGSQNTVIGARASANMHYFPGIVDDVRIYSRALTPGEISNLSAGCPVPTGLAATGGVNQVSLAWTAPPPPAVGTVTYTYNIQRGTSSGTYSPLATGVNATNYVDLTTGGGITYYYVVTAVTAGESGNSLEASATALIPPPRFNDHQEGLFEDRCNCASVPAGSCLLPLGMALALGLMLFLRRR